MNNLFELKSKTMGQITPSYVYIKS